LERLSVALALCETLDRWLPDEHAEPEAYATLIVALEALEAGAPAEQTAAWALWRWLAMLGYCPEMERCGKCGRELLPSLNSDASATNSSNLTPLSPLSVNREGGCTAAPTHGSPSPFTERGSGGEVAAKEKNEAERSTLHRRGTDGEGNITLIPADGLFLCSRCAPQREGVALTLAELKLLQEWIQGERMNIDARPEACRSLMRAALRYAECVLESPVRWLEFWERLNALRESG
jgi:recombinational DNA repair protein (RecF pathway)